MASAANRPPIRDIAELDDALSEPTEATIRALASVEGDIVVLGVGGKMGPTLARMAVKASQRAGVSRRVIGVSRFSGSPDLQERLRCWGVETARCDLLDPKALAELPEAANVVYMAGMKFGSSGQQAMTWAMNTFLPGLVAARYRQSRIVAFSTANVYGLSAVARGGSVEDDEVHPVGEYAMSCLGRERILEHFSRTNRTPMAIVRLNYATELRYGVLVDIALQVRAGKPLPLSMGYMNCIWQADANAASLQALERVSTPPLVFNLSGPEVLSVRRIAEELGKRWGIQVSFQGSESADALLTNNTRCFELFGRPPTATAQMIDWIAEWVARGGANSGKPTHFEERAGNY